jgi:DNA-binding ferritin-like protein
MIEELIARTFSLRNAVHLAHWSTRNFSEHTALRIFYDEILDKLDLIVEAYQGIFGLVGQVSFLVPRSNAIVDEIRAEMEWLADNKEAISKGNAVLANQLDDMGHFYATTLYKLDFLS